MTDSDILKMYNKGLSIKYIANSLYKSKTRENKHKKPVMLDGFFMIPVNLYTKTWCVSYVNDVIYNDLLVRNRHFLSSCD